MLDDINNFVFIDHDCFDLMDASFCEKALHNEYCDDRFYWNGKTISEWCRKICKTC